MRHAETNEWVQAGFDYTTFMNRQYETLFVFLLYGFEFVINIGGPSIKCYKEWLIENNGVSPIIERYGCWLEKNQK